MNVLKYLAAWLSFSGPLLPAECPRWRQEAARTGACPVPRVHEATFQIYVLSLRSNLNSCLCEALLAAWGLLVPPPLNSYSIVGDHLFGLQSNFILL